MASEKECSQVVEGFIARLAGLVASDVESGEPGLRIGRVLEEAYLYASTRGNCLAYTSGLGLEELLRRELESLAKLALDAVMEALSVHMEKVGEELHAELSGLLTGYATHLARIVVVILEAMRQGVDRVVLQALEPLVFASAARLLAVARLVRSTPTEKLPEILPGLRRAVQTYIAEEDEFIANVFYTLTGGAPGLAQGQAG